MNFSYSEGFKGNNGRKYRKMNAESGELRGAHQFHSISEVPQEAVDVDQVAIQPHVLDEKMGENDS